MTNKKGLTTFWAWTVVILVWILALSLLFFLCKALLKESQQIYDIKQNVCHNENNYVLDENNSVIYPIYLSFQMKANEQISDKEIVSYFGQQGYFGDDCNEFWDNDGGCRNSRLSNYQNFSDIIRIDFYGNYIRYTYSEGEVENLEDTINTVNVTAYVKDYRFTVNGKNQICENNSINNIILNNFSIDNKDLTNTLLSQACSCTDKKVLCGMFENQKITKCANGNQMVDCCCSQSACRYDVQFECLKYSCEGNYTVEVVKK
jgi:hypothetical protein